MKTKNFIGLILFIAVLLGVLIYWREYATRDQVVLYQVVLWQLGIWVPWILGFKILDKIIKSASESKFTIPLLLGTGLLLICLHFGWFFKFSSTYSPYLDLEGSKFGVYRYFFIFWTLVDIGLVWFIIDKLRATEKEELEPPLLFELTRGGNKYFCEPSQIHLLAAENYYTKLFTTEGVFVMRKPLKYFHDILPLNTFRKIHRSTIINVNYVSELSRGNDHSLEVIMKDGTRRRVSRSFIKEITLFFKDRTY
ncbi:LytTR family transcriptional regulator [Flagellimonas hymeniacidonis]|uniref:LytTR family transcriptional regulator n=1 Tax=Flagellimonas hymeniacidonis TaxID=2603628 RepID=A0A5C8V6I5_9FLAO|nr:LytTR family DNA-binding domain-containing protein [Flagellimonas hymeniacidonis]TXN37361.1 LytTR family transcriptional regulator [Flagellimonas hymeniacidonis]